MIQPIPTRLVTLLAAAALTALPEILLAVNPQYSISDPDRCIPCEEKAAAEAAAAEASNHSVDLAFNLGGAGYERPNMFSSFFESAGSNLDDPDLPQGMDSIQSYFDQAPLSSLWRATLRLKSATITADTFKPASLTYNTTIKMVVLKDGNGAIRQVLTHDFLVDIQALTEQEGFTAKWYFASEKGDLVGGFYNGPATNATVRKTVTISNPNALGVYTTLDVALSQDASTTTTPPSSSTLTRHYRYVFTATTQTLETWDNVPTASGAKKLADDTLLYLDGTTPSGLAQDRVRTVKVATLPDTGTPGDLVTVSRTREVYSNIGGKKRLTSSTRLSGADNDAGLTTTYGYYSTGDTRNGRPRWQLNPDGSWIVWDLNTSGTNPVIKEITPFENAGMTVAGDGTPSYVESACRVTTRTIIGPQMLISTKVLEKQISSATLLFKTGAQGERILKTTRDGVTTCVAHRAPNSGVLSGRIAWETHEDGTATVYTYSADGSQITATTGPAADNGESAAPAVANHHSTATGYNEFRQPYEQHTYRGAVVVESWFADPAFRDTYGRAGKRVYNNNAADYETFTYNCCGLATHRGRDTSATQYFRDPLGRVYKTLSKATNTSPQITTTTAYSGLTTETATGGIFTSATTRSLDGLTTTTVSPSLKAVSPAALADRLTTRATTTNPGLPITAGPTVKQESLIGGAWLETSTTTSYRDGRTATVSGPAVTAVSYDYDAPATGRLLTTATAGTLVNQTLTDSRGRTVESVSPGSGSTTYTYHDDPNDPAGTRGRLKTVTDADFVTTTYAYPDLDTTTTTRTVPVGANHAQTALETKSTTDLVTNTVSGIGNAIRTVTTLGGIPVSTTFRSFDGLATATVTPTGRSTSVATRPDANTGVSTVTTTHPGGTKTRVTTTPFTTPTPGGTTVFTERLTLATPPAVSTVMESTTQTFDPLGRLLTVSDSRTQVAGQTAYSDFTESGTPLKTTQGTIQGNIRVTTNTCDLLGRVTDTQLPDGSATHTTYDLAGRVKAQWGSMTYPTYRVYDPLGRLHILHTWQTAPDLSQTTDTTIPGDPAATTWNYDYGSATPTGLLLSKLDNDSKGTSYLYTTAGRVWKRTSARNIITEYTYTHGYLTKTDYYDSTPDVTITYDNLGRQKQVTNTLASSSFEYATDFGVAKETITYTLPGQSSFTRVIDRRYRSLGRDSGWELGSSGADLPEHQASYSYNTATGFLETVAGGVVPDTSTIDNPHDYNASDTFTYGYRYTQTAADPEAEPPVPAGARVGSTTGTKQDVMPYTLTKSGTPTLQTIRTYEASRDVLASIQNKTGDTVRSMYDYTTVNGGVNNLGQRMGVQTTFNLTGTATTQATAWGYDSLGQLTAANLPGADLDRTYAYDSIGNRLTAAKGTFAAPGVNSSFTTTFLTEYFGAASSANPPVLSSPGANALNQYAAIKTPSATVKPAHDDDGNMTHGPIPTSPTANRTLVWDAENRLIEVKNSSDVTLVKYTYDALSRRIATKVGTANATLYIYDGWNCIADYAIQDSAFEIQNSNLWGLDLSGSLQGAGGVGGLLAVNDGTTSYYPTYDGNGNISEYLEADGDVAAHYEYDPFGNDISPPPPAGVTYGQFAYRFSTKPVDFTTGLYYYGYRWYDPLTGRWPSRDPIEEQGGDNLYVFLGNGVIARVDRLGLFPSLPPAGDEEDEKKISACKEKSKRLKTEDPRIAAIIKKMRSHRPACSIPEVECMCCRGEGRFQWQNIPREGGISVRIVMCTDFGAEKGETFEDYLYHEYYHALQFCERNEKSNPESFDEALCNEIGAYSIANCNHIVDEKKKEDCVRSGVIRSITRLGTFGDEATVSKKVVEKFDVKYAECSKSLLDAK